MRRVRMVSAAVAGLMALGACSDGGMSGDDLADEYDANRDSFFDRQDRVLGLASTSALEMPTSGSATYEGEAVLDIESPITRLQMVGDATLTANFTAGTLSGQADNFIGTETGEEFEAFEGALILSNGEISGNRASGVLSGTLTGDENTVEVGASVGGSFRGSGGPDALGIYADDSGAQINGDFAPGQVSIVTEIESFTEAAVGGNEVVPGGEIGPGVARQP